LPPARHEEIAMLHRIAAAVIFPLALLTATCSFAAEIVVHRAAVASAAATAETGGSTPVAGSVEPERVVIPNLTPGVAYSLRLVHADGSIDQGVDMSWYDTEPARDDAGDLTDDDRGQITAILKQVLSFFNRNDLILLAGNHDRAVALVQLIRDKSFHSDSGDEVIWRVELWYLKNRHGGWEKIQQTDKTIRRERFSTAAFHAASDHLHWIPELGGLVVPKDQPTLDVTPPQPAK